MAKMTIGSGQPSKKQMLQKEQVFVTEKYDDSQIKERLSQLEAREPQILETRTVETIVEKQPEIHQHVYPIQEAKDLDLSHLVPVERYETEYKMFSQVANKKLDELAQDYNNVNQRIDEVLENQQSDTQKLQQNINDLIQKQQKTTDRFYVFKDKILENKKEIDKFKQDIDTIKEHNKLSSNRIDKVSDRAYYLDEKLTKQLKVQKIINILLVLGLVISLIG